MKAIRSKTLKISFVATLTLFSAVVFAQDKKEKNKVRIKVEQEIDGKNKVYEKVIDGSNLSASEKEEIISKFQDSVMATSKGKSHRVRIEVDDDLEGSKFEKNIEHDERVEREIERSPRAYSFNDNDERIVRKNSPRVRVYRNGGDGQEFDSDDFMKEFRWEMDGLRENMKDLGKDFPKMDFRSFDPADVFVLNGGSSSKTVKNLDVFPNKPNTETLNFRFYAPEKGDVSIKIMDVKGNVVAKEEIKDFSGDYIGQVNIGKQLKGTFFVIVSQGEDGTMKRLVLD